MRAALKSARQKAGLSQQRLAILVGVSQQTVSKHESGKLTPEHFRTIREYERVLRTPAAVLFPDVFTR